MFIKVYSIHKACPGVYRTKATTEGGTKIIKMIDTS